MSEFFKTSVTWVVDFRYDGRPRRWFKAFGVSDDVRQAMVSQLATLYGDRAQLVAVRPATEEEETQYLRGEEPKNVLCPTGRHARKDADPWLEGGELRDVLGHESAWEPLRGVRTPSGLIGGTGEQNMSDEFDDAYDHESLRHSVMPSRIDQVKRRSRVARLMSRAYGAAGAPLRATMLACLVRPLGSLGLVAVASGAFAGLLRRGGERATGPSLDEVGSYSNDQIFQLVRFVEQVSPDAIQQVASLLADSPVGLAAFGAAAVMLLVRATRHQEPTRDRALTQDIVEQSKP